MKVYTGLIYDRGARAVGSSICRFDVRSWQELKEHCQAAGGSEDVVGLMENALSLSRARSLSLSHTHTSAVHGANHGD